MFYEVLIPIGGGATTRSMQVQASTWRSAYRTAVSHVDGGLGELTGHFIDVGFDAVRITDPKARRVIEVRVVDERQVQQSELLKASTGVVNTATVQREAARQAATAAAPPPASGRSGGRRFKDRNTGTFRTIGSTELPSASESGLAGRVMSEASAPSTVLETSGVREAAGMAEPSASFDTEDVSISETALEDVFLEITALFDMEIEDAIDFVLDLALKHVPSAIGGLLFAADTGDHLYFASARGPGRKELLAAKISVGDGLPAWCLRNGVAVAVSDPADDARCSSELADIGGFAVNNLCVAPLQAGERAFGVLLLGNRKERPFFSRYDANILNYIGAQMGEFIQDHVDATPLD